MRNLGTNCSNGNASHAIAATLCVCRPLARRAVLALSFLVLATARADAQDTELEQTIETEVGDSSKEEFKRWIDYYQRAAAAYEFRLASDSGPRLTVSPNPLMTFAHPWRNGNTHGAFFVWTHLGRAELIGAIWSWGPRNQQRQVTHEFHSLSTVGLKPIHVGSYTWTPRTGIELKPIPGATPPRKSAAVRLAQMRSLARQFTGFCTPHEREERLRTLDQPLFRYTSESPEVLDGAVFGMFKDWDPDIILLIEARKIGDHYDWVYGYGRFNGRPLRLEHKGVEVWNEGLVPLRVPVSNFFAAYVDLLTEPPATAE